MSPTCHYWKIGFNSAGISNRSKQANARQSDCAEAEMDRRTKIFLRSPNVSRLGHTARGTYRRPAADRGFDPALNSADTAAAAAVAVEQHACFQNLGTVAVR